MRPSLIYHGKTDPARGLFYGLPAPLSFSPEITLPGFEGKPVPTAEVDLAGVPTRVKWSNQKAPPPLLGARVRITFNELGAGTVVGYFVEHGYLGVEVRCENRPAWHVRQNGDKHPHPLVFGAEIRID